MDLRHAPVLAGLLLVSCSASVAAVAVESSPQPAGPSTSWAWERLCGTLPGRWQGRLGDDVVEVSYRMTARGSVLLETWMPGTPAETLTAYHLDDGAVMLTHYCGQGNQPRLRLAEAESNRLRFTRFDATDVSAEEAALFELELVIDGPRLTRSEVYTRAEDRESSTLELFRLPSTLSPSSRS